MIGLGNATDTPRVSLFAIQTPPGTALTSVGVAAAAGGSLLGGAAQGALLAGLASWSGKTAATGALLGAGVAGALSGAGLLAAAYQLAQPTADGQPPETPTATLDALKYAGVGALALSVLALTWGGVRVYKTARKGA